MLIRFLVHNDQVSSELYFNSFFVSGELTDDKRKFVVATELGEEYQGGDRIWRQSKCWHTLHLEGDLVINASSEWYGCEGYENKDFKTTFDNTHQLGIGFEGLKSNYENIRPMGYAAIQKLIKIEVLKLSEVIPPLMGQNSSDEELMKSVLWYYGSGEQFVTYNGETIPEEIRTSRGSYSCAEKMMASKFDEICKVLTSKSERTKILSAIQSIELLSTLHSKVEGNCHPNGIPFWDMVRMIKKIIQQKSN